MSVNPTHKPQRNTAERATKLAARRARQDRRDIIATTRQEHRAHALALGLSAADADTFVARAGYSAFTPVPKTGWRAKAAAKATA